MNARLSQGTGEVTEVPDIDFEFFDLNLPLAPQFPPEPAYSFFFTPNTILPHPNGSSPVCNYQTTAAQGAIENLNLLVGDLLGQVTALQSQLEIESR
ncbi:hypothetical protein BJX63DRAFT_435939 [Aspergillus granulosus]|uniref:Uncharacterized protein n=1 Tax=Aspergillus granulosus TaxID=176169 RepID=A0ABR4GZR5_9EURO